jgi:hypothetical protein
MIDRIEFDADFPGGKKHIEITAPMGAGGIYHILVDRYFNGQLMYSNGEWRCALNSKTVLAGDDVSVIIGMLEEKQNAGVIPGIDHLISSTKFFCYAGASFVEARQKPICKELYKTLFHL